MLYSFALTLYLLKTATLSTATIFISDFCYMSCNVSFLEASARNAGTLESFSTNIDVPTI